MEYWAQTAGYVEGENDERKWWWWDKQWTTTGRKSCKRRCGEASGRLRAAPRAHNPGWSHHPRASLGASFSTFQQLLFITISQVGHTIQEPALGVPLNFSTSSLHHHFPAWRCPCLSSTSTSQEGEKSAGGARGRRRRRRSPKLSGAHRIFKASDQIGRDKFKK